MQYKIFHETIFNYNTEVSFSHNIAKLKPASTQTQKLLDYKISIDPNSKYLQEYKDYFGNEMLKIFIKKSHKELRVKAESLVEIDDIAIRNKISNFENINISQKDLNKHLSSNQNDEIIFLKQFLFPSTLIPYPNPKILRYAKRSFTKNKNLYLAIKDLINRIFTDFEFMSGFSDISTPIDIIFEQKKGVCQDFASLSISALRALGIPTRYVSGYIQTIPPQDKEKLFGADASHAWFSVYLGEFGWVDFDPTNNKIVNEEYIILGYGRDYNDITPLKGTVVGSGNSILKVMVDVREF